MTRDRTARQVHIPGGLIHRLALADGERAFGRYYVTDCDRKYWGYQGAVLTTAEVDCKRCNGIAVTP